MALYKKRPSIIGSLLTISPPAPPSICGKSTVRIAGNLGFFFSKKDQKESQQLKELMNDLGS